MITLYLCAGAVVVAGSQVLVALGGPPVRWWRPVPWAAAALVAVLAAMAVVQLVHPAAIGALERDPGGGWWRCVTGLLVQSSGGFQLWFNLAALAAVAPVAQRVLGPWWMLLVYLTAGIAAQVVSAVSWSRHGGGDSVAICGLVGALTVLYSLRGTRTPLRGLALLAPAAGVVLCVVRNNHGMGVVVGGLFGLALGLAWPRVAGRPRLVEFDTAAQQ